MKLEYFYYSTDWKNDQKGTTSDWEEIVELFHSVKPSDDSFFGLVNEKETILQFAWEEEDIWLVDIPDMAQNGSYIKKGLSREDCLVYMKDFYNGKDIDLSKLEFNSFS